MPKARAHVIFSGRVQGVFFRAFTEEVARSLGLKGWVMNIEGGRVEAVFEGERNDIDRAILLCKKGPPSARVDDVNVSWEEPSGEFSMFSARHY